ncbi:RICIN domain-containing protein, partial [Lentzea kentuckyensis]|uniref:RICIN domain-containing protein n=1 Tax=Lentzea kentuckyensis TaxID=360086 RepID=UPI001179B08D
MGMKKLCVALTAIALGAVTAAPASAAQDGNRIIEIRNVGHNLCIDNTPRDGYRPSVATCTGSPAQRYEVVPAAAGKVFLRSVEDGTCLDRLGQSLSLHPMACNVETTTQRAELVPDGPGIVKLRFQDRFAQVLYEDMGVIFSDEDMGDYEQWEIREVGVVPPPTLASVVRLRNADSKTCLTGSGTKPAMAPCATELSQAFELGESGGVLRNKASGKCLANPRFDEVTAVTSSKRG